MSAFRKQDLAQFLAETSPRHAVICVYGANEQKTRGILQDIIKAQLGNAAKDELRLETLSPQELGKTAMPIVDLARASGFFSGARGVQVFGANENNKAAIDALLEEWQPGDATLYMQMGALKKSSKTRQLLEKDPRCAIIAIYDDPLTRAEFDKHVANKNLHLEREAANVAYAIARSHDESLLSSFLEILALYQGDAGNPLTESEVLRLAPSAGESDIDDIVAALSKGNRQVLHQSLKQAEIAGTNIQTILGAALRHFTRLHYLKAQSNPAGAIGQMRPPVFGAARDALIAQVRVWNLASIEIAIETLSGLENSLRTTSTLPNHAMLERAFMKVASVAPRS